MSKSILCDCFATSDLRPEARDTVCCRKVRGACVDGWLGGLQQWDFDLSFIRESAMCSQHKVGNPLILYSEALFKTAFH